MAMIAELVAAHVLNVAVHAPYRKEPMEHCKLFISCIELID